MSFLSGLFDTAMDIFGLDQSKRADAKNRKFQWKVLQEQQRYQKEFAQHGMRWRVEDAKAAGLHPLSVLGAQGLPAYSPVSADSSPTATATAIGRGFRAPGMNRGERAAQMMAIREAQSRVKANEAEAAYYSAMAGRVGQQQGYSAAFPEVNAGPEVVTSTLGAGENTPTAGLAELVSPKVNTSRPGSGGGVVAGPANPAMREFALPGGFKMLLPDATSLGEALEPLSESWVLAWGIYKENARQYGPQWEQEFKRRYGVDWIMKLQDSIGGSQDWIRDASKGFRRNTGKGKFLPPRSGR